MGAACSATARAIVETPLEYVKVGILFTKFRHAEPKKKEKKRKKAIMLSVINARHSRMMSSSKQHQPGDEIRDIVRVNG